MAIAVASATPILRPTVTANPAVISRAVDAYLARDEPLMFDVETTSLDPRVHKLVMVQLRQPSSRTTLIIDWRPFYQREAAPQRRVVRDALIRLFASRQAVGHNLKFDSEFLLAQGVRLPKVFDTMLAEQLLYAGQSGIDFHLAATLERRGLGAMDKTAREWFFSPAPLDERPAEWDAPFPEEEVTYAAADVECLPALYEAQRRDLARDGLRWTAHIEMRVLPAVALMEMRGVRVNQDGWREVIADQAKEAAREEDTALRTLGPAILATRIDRYDGATAAWKQAREELDDFTTRTRWWYENLGGGAVPVQDGETWGAYKQREVAKYRETHAIPAKPKLDTSLPNIGSTQQLAEAMRALNIPVPTRRNEKGVVADTTDSDSLERLVPQYPVLRPVLKHRRASKIVDAFGEKLLAFADAKHRIHPDYHQLRADTGRFSCSGPNWQQIPSADKSEVGAKLRRCVIAGEGHKLITADFSNIEMRIIAELSGDQKMLAMFASGEDLHSYTAKLLFKLPMDWTKQQTTEHLWRGMSARKGAKIVNYLIPYGGSPFAIAAQYDLPLEVAEELHGGWFALFDGVKAWMAQLGREAHSVSITRTRSGRLRHLETPGPEPSRRYRPYDALAGVPDGWEKTEDGSQLREPYPAYMDRLKGYRRAWGGVERQARNSPVQGLSADITKLAMALFYERCAWQVGTIVAVVHDELVAEALEANAPLVADIMASSMEDACHHFLQVVAIPRPEPTIAEYWTHE